MSPRPFREWQPEQGQLLPQYTREALGEKHLVCFFADLARVLDFSAVLKAYTKECGQPPYHPVMMTLLLMYAYARGVNSNREIERRCETDLAFRYLSGGERPDHDTLCTFRVRHLDGLPRFGGHQRCGDGSVDARERREPEEALQEAPSALDDA